MPEYNDKNINNNPLCACGCGEHVTKPTNKYIWGHHSRVLDCTWNRGLTKETDERIMSHSKKLKGRTKETHAGIKSQSEKMKIKPPFFKGKKHSVISRKRMSDSIKLLKIVPWNKGKTKETSKRLQNVSEKLLGENHPQFKGLESGKCANYDNYSEKISFCEQIRRNEENLHILEVKCSYCGKWYKPSTMDVINRISGLDNDTNKFYCSNNCKELCPIYMKRARQEGEKNKNSRTEVSAELRKMVIERDNWECQKCESKENLECHHVDPVSENPMLANDIDSCITLCTECHKEIHMKVDGCRYNELKKC